MPLLQVHKKWDDEADVVVVGAGNGGFPAAITAADKGAKVIVLELWSAPASSLAMIAGGTIFAGTDFQKAHGIDDSPDKLFNEAVEKTGGSPELWRVLADRQLDAYAWLQSIGAKPAAIFGNPGQDTVRCHRFEGHGTGLLKTLRHTADNKGIKTLYKHRAERLVVDPTTGRVVGVTARHDDKVLNDKSFGIVVYSVSGIVKDVPVMTIFRGAFPYFIVMAISLVIFIAFPEISLLLPNLMRPAG